MIQTIISIHQRDCYGGLSCTFTWKRHNQKVSRYICDLYLTKSREHGKPLPSGLGYFGILMILVSNQTGVYIHFYCSRIYSDSLCRFSLNFNKSQMCKRYCELPQSFKKRSTDYPHQEQYSFDTSEQDFISPIKD